MTDEILFLFIRYHEAIRAEREHEHEHEAHVREVMIARDNAVDALKSALGDGRRAEIDAMVFPHETPSALRESVAQIAAYIDGRLNDPKDAARLIACGINADCAATLWKHAEALSNIESTPPALPTPLETPRAQEDKPKKRGFFQRLGLTTG